MSNAGLPMSPQNSVPTALPADAPAGTSLAAPGAPEGMMDHLQQQHDQSAAMYRKLSESSARMMSVREMLDSLGKMGDMVTQDDVVKASGKLVGAGIDAGAVAGILSEMPPDGEALQAWIAARDADITQREAALSQQLSVARHQMGVNGLRLLMGHGANPQSAAQAPQAPSGAAVPGPLSMGNADAN